MRRTSLALVLTACSAPAVIEPQPFDPVPPAERSGYERTSTPAEVTAFLGGLVNAPQADRLRVERFGTSGEGRPLWCVVCGAPPPVEPSELGDRTVVLVNANIHGGEVEGKEAMLRFLSEVAVGDHGDLLEELVILIVPQFNVDGDAARDPRERVAQNGPEVVGARANAAGLDLNRDFVKLESPEVRALTGLFRRWDPHLLMDLHATNGTHHGYHLTYAPSLSSNVDPAIDAFCRQVLLAGSRARLAEEGIRVFDYGNLSRGEPRVWATYDHRPRFGTNLYGLRNRFSVLSEAYVYLDFAERVRVTYAFVGQVLALAAEHGAEMRALCALADARATAGGLSFGHATRLAEGSREDILLGAVREVPVGDLGNRVEALDEVSVQPALARVAFESQERVELPWGWLVPDDPRVRRVLLEHGLTVFSFRPHPDQELARARFSIDELERARRPFQGHLEVRLEGSWGAPSARRFTGDEAYLVVPARQALGRLAAQLLEAQSEDSLSTWNLFDELGGFEGDAPEYPVERLVGPPVELVRLSPQP